MYYSLTHFVFLFATAFTWEIEISGVVALFRELPVLVQSDKQKCHCQWLFTIFSNF